MIWMLILSSADARQPKKPLPPVDVEVAPPVAPVPELPAKMNNDRLAELLARVSAPGSRKAPNYWEFELQGLNVIVITDENADRMRMMAPVATEADLTGPQALRLLQANFDSALDARYAVAKGYVWSTFIHPLGSLTDDDLISGLAQVVGCGQTYGTSYTSGALIFGGGDSEKALESYEEVIKSFDRI